MIENSSSSLQFQSDTLGALFAQFAPFQVPAYQRAYAWEDEQIHQFVEDLREHPGGDYYLGHFLLEKAGDGVHFVIDGQQRLTTLMLAFGIMARLRAPDGSRGESAAAFSNHFLGGPLGMRFQTVAKDQSLLSGLVFGDLGGATPSHRTRSQKHLIKACQALHTAFSKESPEQLDAQATVLANAKVTHLVVESKVQATQIFTFQNSRGKKLTEFEKLKAFLMQQVYLHAPRAVANQAISQVEEHFATMYQDMEEINVMNENDALRYHDHAYSAHWTSPVENLKKDLSLIPDSTEKVSAVCRFCERLSNTFSNVRRIEALLHTEEQLADPIILDAGAAWPLIIKLYGLLSDSILQRAEVRKMLRDLEKSLFKMEFQHGRVSTNLILRTKQLASLADLPALCDSLSVAVHQGFGHNRWNFDSNALAFFKADNHYYPITRYVLWKYENSLGACNDRKVSAWEYLNPSGKRNMQPTLEHVSARNPREANQTPEFASKFLNNMGNLAFMPKGMNSSLGNSPEAEKQPFMRNSSYAGHREVAEMMGSSAQWTPDIILARKAKILDFVLRRWEIPVPEVTSTPV